MTPEQQVKEIVGLLSPTDQNQTDAVFLVQRMIQRTQEKLKTADKQIAKLEADLEATKTQLHDLINQKLEVENRLKMANLSLKAVERKEETETVIQEEPVDNTPTEEEEVPRGQKGN